MGLLKLLESFGIGRGERRERKVNLDNPEEVVSMLERKGFKWGEIPEERSKEPFTIIFAARDSEGKQRFYSIHTKHPVAPGVIAGLMDFAEDYCRENELEFQYLRGNHENSHTTIGPRIKYGPPPARMVPAPGE